VVVENCTYMFDVLGSHADIFKLNYISVIGALHIASISVEVIVDPAVKFLPP